MDIKEALHKISEIHTHMSKSEIFQGYHPPLLFAVGGIALIFSSIQYFFIKPNTIESAIIQWAVAGLCIALAVAGNILKNYLFNSQSAQRRLAFRVLMQFLPSIAAGIVITVLFLSIGGNIILYLPGIWSILFSLGLFSMLPFLPSGIISVAIFYFAVGCFQLYILPDRPGILSISVGGSFGLGHIFSALILLERIRRKKDYVQ